MCGMLWGHMGGEAPGTPARAGVRTGHGAPAHARRGGRTNGFFSD